MRISSDIGNPQWGQRYLVILEQSIRDVVRSIEKQKSIAAKTNLEENKRIFVIFLGKYYVCFPRKLKVSEGNGLNSCD